MRNNLINSARDKRRIILLSSWNPEGMAGSGVAASVRGIREGLAGRGREVRVICRRHDQPGYLRNSLARLAWNLRLDGAAFPPGVPVLAFDFDGFNLPETAARRLIQINGGILKDLLPFERGLPRWMLGVLAALEGRLARRAALVAAPSRYAAGRVTDLYGVDPARVRVVPLGLHPRQAAGDPGPEDGSKPPVILWVAQLYPRKGLDLLLAAFALTAGPGGDPEVRLEIAGDGLLSPYLRRQLAVHPCRERIRWLGPVPPEQIAGCYRRASIFCLPSRHETFGLAFLEAMASGLPVVALHKTAVPELVRPGQEGWLAGDEEPSTLAGLLLRLLRDPRERERLGRNGRRRAAGFTWSRTAEQLDCLLDELSLC